MYEMNKLYAQAETIDFTDSNTRIFYNLNKSCANDLSKAIDNHYDGYRLGVTEVLSDILSVYEPERIAYVLAVRVYDNEGFDGRFSKANENWAKELLKNVSDVYKDKQDSPIRYELHFLSSHNGLADMVMTAFRKNFPDVKLEPHTKPITSEIKPTQNSAILNSNSFNAEYDETKDMGYLIFDMEYPDSQTAWFLMKREADIDNTYINDTLLNKNECKTCCVDIYEDGNIILFLSGHSISLSSDEEQALKNNLEKYTKGRFHLSLPKAVFKAINGEKPLITRSNIER